MNFADLEKTWRSPLNQPDPAALENMKKQFIAEHDRRRQAQKRFLFFVVLVLTYFSVRLVVPLLRSDPAKVGFDLAREWGAVILLLLPWVGVIFLVRQLVQHDRAHGSAIQTLAGSIRALLDEIRVSRVRLKIVAALHGATLLVLPLVVYQLRAVGKAGEEIMLPAFVAWPLIAGGILLGLGWHDRRTLRPRQHELEALLRSYE